jgi:putative hydrolase of the HAD superfamily
MERRISRPKAVLFDLFDTLVPAMATGHTIPPTWEDLGIPLEAYQQRWVQNHDGRATGRIRDQVEVLRVVAHDLDPTIPIEKIAWAAERRARRFEHVLTSVDSVTVAAVARLRESGVKTALVSNACVGEIESWPRSPFAAHFDAAVFSCHVGVAKPDRGIYDEALARVGVAGPDAIFVGDGGSDEHRGARALGMRTALISGLAHGRWARAMEERRTLVDWEFADVASFVEALEP